MYLYSGPGGPHDGGGEEDGEASHLQGKPTILSEMSGNSLNYKQSVKRAYSCIGK